MTVLAWDGATLAADRACDIGGIQYSVTKVVRVGDALLGLAGDGTRLEQLRLWFDKGADPEKYPPRPTENSSVLVVIDRYLGRVRIRRFEGTGYPIILETPLYADGAGRDVALAAMHCGKSAREAVELTCALTAYCGLGVDEIRLEE